LAVELDLVVAPEVAVFVAQLGVLFLVVQPEVVALVSAAPEPSLEAVVLAVGPVAEVVSFVAVVSLVDIVELRISVGIRVASVVSVPASVPVAEVGSSEHPRSVPFANVDCFATAASSVEAVGDQCVHSTTGSRTNDDLCSALSTLDLYQNKILGHYGNSPSHGHNTVSDTIDRPTDATTSHSRKRGLCQSQGQRTHRPYQATLPRPAVPRMGRAAADRC